MTDSITTIEDVTNDWVIMAKPNSHKVKDRKFFEHRGHLFKVDGKTVVLEYSSKEKEKG